MLTASEVVIGSIAVPKKTHTYRDEKGKETRLVKGEPYVIQEHNLEHYQSNFINYDFYHDDIIAIKSKH